MVKKTLLSLAVAAATAGLAGCNISSVEGNNVVDQTAVEAGTTTSASTVTPVFNVARKNLPLATDFLFSGSTDGTLVYPAGDVDLFLADGSRNPEYNPVYDALNDLDGFSTSGQLYLEFSGELATTVAVGSVYLVPMNYTGGPKLGTLDTSAPLDAANMVAVRADVVSYPDSDMQNNVLRISPLTPLKNDTRYLVVLTNKLLDADGEPTAMPSQYDYLIGDEDLLNAALAPARTAMQGWIQLARALMAGVGGSADDVTLAYTMTTGGTVEVLSSMAAPGNADSALASTVPAFLQNYMNTTTDDASTQVGTITAVLSGDSTQAQTIYGGHQLLKTLPAPMPRVTDFSSASSIATATMITGAQSTFLTGSIDLPYYSEAPVGAYSDDGVALNPAAADNYVCDTASVGEDAATCAAIKASAANTIVGQWESDADVIVDLKIATGTDETTAAAYQAPSENVTNLFPFAKENGKVLAPVLVVEPISSCVKPSTGWPVVIYQHGITSNRMATLPLADQLAQACYATVAIDLPMHGLMPTDLVTSGTYAGSGLPAMAIVAESAGGYPVSTFAGLNESTQALVISGETLKQRHFGLTAAADGVSPTAVSGVETDASGSLYITFLRFQTTRDNNRQAVMDLLNLNASIPFMDIDNDGNGGIANSSPDFDKDKIYFAGISLGSILGTQFVAVNNANVVAANSAGNIALNRIQAAVFAVPGGGLAKLLENSQTFGPRIVGALTSPSGFNLTQGGDSFESLQYVYQATVDSADPINFGGLMQLTQTPYSIIESVGDTVVPNSVDSAPLAGTDPMIAAFNATQVDTSSTLTASGQVYFKLADDYSSHTSMAVPDTDDATPETAGTFAVLATHIISLFSGSPVLDDSVYGSNIVEAVEE